MTSRPTSHVVPMLESVDEVARQYPQIDAEVFRTYLMLRRTQHRLDRALESHFARYDLSFGRFMVMVHLAKADGHSLTPAELSQRCGVTRATITGLLDALESSQFVARESDPDDGRSVVIHLTTTGKRFLDKLLPDHFGRLTALMKGFTRGQLKDFQKMLSTVAESAAGLEVP